MTAFVLQLLTIFAGSIIGTFLGNAFGLRRVARRLSRQIAKAFLEGVQNELIIYLPEDTKITMQKETTKETAL